MAVVSVGKLLCCCVYIFCFNQGRPAAALALLQNTLAVLVGLVVPVPAPQKLVYFLFKAMLWAHLQE